MKKNMSCYDVLKIHRSHWDTIYFCYVSSDLGYAEKSKTEGSDEKTLNPPQMEISMQKHPSVDRIKALFCIKREDA